LLQFCEKRREPAPDFQSEEIPMRVTKWLRGLVPALALAAPLSAQAQGELVLYCTVQEEW